jgi:aminoglycoside phosphotransferase (APT) family kinase protein
MADQYDVAQRVDPTGHPAVVAWSRVGAGSPPGEVRVLKERSKGLRKSAVYWLKGAGPRGEPVVAKLAKRERAALEALVYGEVLPDTSVSAPHLYGTVEDHDGWTWVFLEHVVGERYSVHRPDHRRAAAAWAARLHAGAMTAPARHRLPDRGLDMFRTWARRGRHALAAAVGYPTITSEEARTAEALHETIDLLDREWDEVSGACSQLPSTVIHGDLVRKNLLVCRHGGEARVVAFDWECAGWGSPALDLADGGSRGEVSQRLAVSPCLETYRTELRARGHDVEREVVARCAALGTALRCVSGILWSALGLDASWVHQPMADMAVYRGVLEESMAAAGIGGRRGCA